MLLLELVHLRLLSILFIRFIYIRSFPVKLPYRKPMFILTVIFKHHCLGISNVPISCVYLLLLLGISFSLLSKHILAHYPLILFCTSPISNNSIIISAYILPTGTSSSFGIMSGVSIGWNRYICGLKILITGMPFRSE